MRLTPWEEERLLIFSAAELARRHRAAGLGLNHPEAVALICDAMLEAARAGGSYAEAEAAGRAAVREDELIDGVRALLDEVRLEVLLGDGTRLVVLVDPLSSVDPLGASATVPAGSDAGAQTGSGPGDRAPQAATMSPGEARLAPDVVELAAGRERRTLVVENHSRRVVRVSSHYPFERTNQRLVFDRVAGAGFRLDIPAGDSVRWAPGEVRSVVLVRYGGRGGHSGRSTGVDPS